MTDSETLRQNEADSEPEPTIWIATGYRCHRAHAAKSMRSPTGAKCCSGTEDIMTHKINEATDAGTIEQYGIVTRIGWEEKEGIAVFTATVEYRNGPPKGETETFATVWDETPVQIIKIDELYALRAHPGMRRGRVLHRRVR